MAYLCPKLFLSVNEKWIRDRLIRRGYDYYPNGYGEWSIKEEHLPYIMCDVRTFDHGKRVFPYFMGKNMKPASGFDLMDYYPCGTNVELFLSLAALRNDSDIYQWFINTNTGRLHNCQADKLTAVEDREHWRKLSKEELIERFSIPGDGHGKWDNIK